MKNVIKPLVALVIVIGLALYAYYGIFKNEEARKENYLNERSLVRFNLDNIKYFTLARPDSSVVFERGVGRIWNIVEPVVTEADGKPLYQLFYILDQTDIISVVEENPKDLEPYGLKNPPYYMAMEYENGDTDSIFVGNGTPDATMTYVKFASENRVLAVNNQVSDIITRPLRYFRSRTILNVVDKDINMIEIFRTVDGKEENITVGYNGVSWEMTKPWQIPADQKNIEDLAKKLSETTKRALIDEKPEDMSKYGLDNPSIIVNLALKYGMADKMLIIGNKVTEPGRTNQWYAKEFANDLVFTLDNTLITLLTRKDVWFVEKQPMQFNRNAIDQIVLETGENSIQLMKDAEGNWNAVSPVDKNITIEAINSLFAISRFLLINDIYTFQPTEEELATAGLKNPNHKIRFYSNGRQVVEALYGRTITSDHTQTYVTTSLSPIVFMTGSDINSSVNMVLNDVFGNE